MASVFRRHIYWVLGTVAAGLVVWLVMRQARKPRAPRTELDDPS
jgi:hypothetical protein